ncbi:MAG TPA: hypothetical protein VGM88_04385 [Kofleriaceae bacterium]|jgi:hypothetical protein
MKQDPAWRTLLHDAAIGDCEVDWARGEIRISVRTASAPYTIRATEFRRLVWDRTLPWGAANTIYGATDPQPIDGGGCYVELELQSGDIVRIEAMAVTLESV